jgi:two-component system, NtrC family, response regulator AtoC
MAMPRDSNPILVIDDDPSIRETLKLYLSGEGHEVFAAGTLRDGRAWLDAGGMPDLVILDVWLPDGKGVDFIPFIREFDPELPVIVVTAQHEMEVAIKAMKHGASDYLTKPVSLNELQTAIDKALRERASYKHREVITLGSSAYAGDRLVGEDTAMLEIEKTLGRLAATRTTVLIEGESGTGKELVARILHRHSEAAGPFVGINCAAMVPTLIESELFGHERGAFTGAVKAKAGKMELAGDGTVFFDEVAELPLELQAKLLRVLQEREFERVGGVQTLPVKARIVAATNRDLRIEVAKGRFREDLFHRLSVVTLRLPPLRERPGDIPRLVTYLLDKISRQLEGRITGVDADVLDMLKSRPWPGNVRELENTLIRACVRASNARVLLPEHFDPPSAETARAQSRAAMNRSSPEFDASGEVPSLEGDDDDAEPTSLGPWPTGAEPSSLSNPGVATAEGSAVGGMANAERQAIVQALLIARGHKGRACEILGVSRPTLDRKLRKYQINFDELRARARTLPQPLLQPGPLTTSGAGGPG